MNKKCLIIVCSYNSKEYTKRLYDELSTSDLIDILIVDNSSIHEEISNFGNYIHIGYDNVEFGGMHDFILNLDLINNYNFVGIFNNDIFGFTAEHFKNLSNYLQDDVGYVSFSISPLVDKAVAHVHGGIMCTKPHSLYRTTNFIENVAPIYSIKILNELKKYMPIHKYGLIDFFMSNKSNELGLKNIIIDNYSFHHIRSGVRKKTGSLQDYFNNGTIETINWIKRHPEIKKYL